MRHYSLTGPTMDDLESLYDQLDAYAVVIRNRDKRIAELEARIAAADAQGPAAWITKEQLAQLEELTSDAWVYWAETGHVAESDEVALYIAPQPTPSAIEAWAALIANDLLGQASEEDVREVEFKIYELLEAK